MTRRLNPGTDWVASAWAWIVCPTVFLLSYVPLLNLYARGVLVIFIGWFVATIVTGRHKLELSGPIVMFIAWSFYALAVSLLAIDLDLALRKWLTIVSVGLMALAVFNAVIWSGSVRSWAWAYVISAMLAYLSNYLPLQGYIVAEYNTEVLGRFVGTLGNANTFGRSMVQAFLIAIGLLIYHSKAGQGLVAILSMGVLGLAVIESSSRTAMLGLALATVALFRCVNVRRLMNPANFAALWGVAAAIAAVFAYFPAKFESAVARMTLFFSFLGLTPAIDSGERSLDNRWELAVRAVDVWWEHPLGVGLDNFREFVGTYAHSNYLEILVSTGALGLILYYSGIAMLVVKQFSTHAAYSIAWRRGILWFIGVVAVMDAFNVSYYSKTFWTFIGIMTGMATYSVAASHAEGKKRRDASQGSV